MFTLSDASTDVRKIIAILGVIIGAILVIFLIIQITLFIRNSIFPPAPSAPTVSFGKLQPQIFPANATNNNLSFSVNTLTGTLPDFGTQAKIYRIQKIQPDLLAIKNFEQKAMAADFLPGYATISDKIFEWKSNTNNGEIEKRIRTNIIDGSFTITSNYQLDKDILAGKNLPPEDKALDMAQSFLQDMQLISDDIDLSKNKTNLYFVNSGVLSHATSLSNSQIIEVNFFQKDVNKLPIFYENPLSSNIKLLVAGGGVKSQIVGGTYIHQTISANENSTYPIKSTSQAFEDLKKGKGYIATYTGNSTSISITDVTFGYYIGTNPQDFLMPIYVFKGDNGFTAYVPAVTDEWIGN